MKRLLCLVVVTGTLACGDSTPKPPPPPVTTTSPPEPVIPPESQVQPEDYITLARAGELTDRCATSTGLLQTLCYYEQQLIWDGVRNPEYALEHCCNELPGPWEFLVMHNGEGCTSPDIEINRQAYQELLGFMGRLQQVNKRCDELPRFCGRTDVKRKRFSEWREQFLDPALELSGKLNGISAWCKRQ